MRLLLFSNSTNSGEEYLNFTLPYLYRFINEENKSAMFIPYASVTIEYDKYFEMVSNELKKVGINLLPLHHYKNQIKALNNAEMIVIGGGNTFCLLKVITDLNLLKTIKDKVLNGIPYIGWSAGSNLACPTIKTTNDMPIIMPKNLDALNLVPFQINPHYTDFIQAGHSGESREMRINEFLTLNKKLTVVGLREGTLLEIANNHILLKGDKSCRLFQHDVDPKEINPGTDIKLFLNKETV